jgi:hypothetical protein
VYISRDVVFDEHVFPFSQMHLNVGARLRAELSIPPYVLLNPSSSFGDAILHDQHGSLSAPTNPASSTCDPVFPVENLVQCDGDLAGNL